MMTESQPLRSVKLYQTWKRSRVFNDIFINRIISYTEVSNETNSPGTIKFTNYVDRLRCIHRVPQTTHRSIATIWNITCFGEFRFLNIISSASKREEECCAYEFY